MLVYLKEPMGIKDIGEYTIRGKKYSYGTFGPTDIPLKMYKEYKDYLISANYTKKWLDSKYNRSFPDITFDITLNLPDNTLKEIAGLIGIKLTYGKRHELTLTERNALKKSILTHLSD